MKLYKFRSLANDEELNRVKIILETGKFWCSNFWELNDPMEGVYLTLNNKNVIEKIFKAKSKYKICSFSGKKGFNEPTLWGYYANGFKGVAIEIEIEKDKIEKINYVHNLPYFDECDNNDENVKKILTSKLKCWKKEDEYRFLNLENGNLQPIGKITSIYFGNPYDNIINKAKTNSKDIIKDYLSKKDILENSPSINSIVSNYVYINGNKIFSTK